MMQLSVYRKWILCFEDCAIYEHDVSVCPHPRELQRTLDRCRWFWKTNGIPDFTRAKWQNGNFWFVGIWQVHCFLHQMSFVQNSYSMLRSEMESPAWWMETMDFKKQTNQKQKTTQVFPTTNRWICFGHGAEFVWTSVSFSISLYQYSHRLQQVYFKCISLVPSFSQKLGIFLFALELSEGPSLVLDGVSWSCSPQKELFQAILQPLLMANKMCWLNFFPRSYWCFAEVIGRAEVIIHP